MGVTWITGNTGSGKTTLARKMKNNNNILLDGDDMRGVWTDLKLTKADRCENNLRIARLAALLDRQGFEVIVAVIAPYRELRKQIKKITKCKFIYVEGGREGDQFPYEHPNLY